jgi:hypothetical protein
MDYWVKQPTFDDKEASWIGPIESAGTFSVGRVFDIYKPLRPDPFFLEVHHFGVRYASLSPPRGRRYGEPPLLAIAQNAIRAALDPGKIDEIGDDDKGHAGPSFSRLVRHWIAQGSAVELRAQLDAARLQANRQRQQREDDNEAARRQVEELKQLNDQLALKIATRDQQIAQERLVHSRSLRWLLGALRAELLRRLRGCTAE